MYSCEVKIIQQKEEDKYEVDHRFTGSVQHGRGGMG